MPSRVTMADVARAAGVHQTTVSLALRNDSRLPAQTRARLKLLAREMGYSPNPLVSALISDRKKKRDSQYASTLAFLTSYKERGQWRTFPNYWLIYKQLEQCAALRGYRIEEFWLTEPGMAPQRLQQILVARGIRGILVCPLPSGMDRLAFDFSEFAAVAIGHTLQSPVMDHVAVDYYTIVQQAVKYLQDRGCRDFGFVTMINIDERVNQLSRAAYLALWQRDRRSHRLPLILPETGRLDEIFKCWLGKRPPRVILTSTRHEFAQVVGWLKALGIRIPEEVSVVNLDKVVSGDSVSEAGMVQNLEEEARAAVELVAGRVENAFVGAPNMKRTILVPGVWSEGWSCLDQF